MNYYPFHIGDYASATRHLSWDEDAAYRRLLDACYTTEKPLPTELRAVCRLVLATTESQRDAVKIVLNEFFVLTSAGWINNRADAEIDAMRDKQAMNETRDLHEKERMRRHRERRAEMFEALREVNIIPAWDVAIKELQRLHDAHCNAPPATHMQREQAVTGDAPTTAIPTPTPTPTPTPSIKEGESSAKAPRPTKKCPADFEVTPEMEQWAKVHKATVDLKTETEKFKDYTFTRAMTDWVGAWRNWIRKAQEYAEKPKKSGSFISQNTHKYAAAGRAIFDDDEPENSIKHMGDIINA